MADDDSPRPFRRERNLSNRNFAKRNSTRRRFSTESHSSVDSLNVSSANHTSMDNNSDRTNKSRSGTPNGALAFNYSDASGAAYNMKLLSDMLPPDGPPPPPPVDVADDEIADPALLDVKQKVQRFETMQAEDNIIFKTGGKYQLTSGSGRLRVMSSMLPICVLPPRTVLVLPTGSPVRLNASPAEDISDAGNGALSSPRSPRARSPRPSSSTPSQQQPSIDEEDDGADMYGYVAPGKPAACLTPSEEFLLAEVALEMNEQRAPSPARGFTGEYNDDINTNALELGVDDFGKVITVRAASPPPTISSPTVVKPKRRTKKGRNSAGATTAGLALQLPPTEPTTMAQAAVEPQSNGSGGGVNDFPRNYRNAARPKTELIGTKNPQLIGKFSSFCYPADNDPIEEQRLPEDEDEAELRNKSDKYVQPILDELINTEETYVENLLIGIENYGNIFKRKDLPLGLRGKKYVLLGNIEQLAEFHRDEFLPMLKRNRRDLKRLFDEFQTFIDQHCFYGYVTFTMNKQRSLKLCDVFKNYFKLIQTSLNDKLGINSFLVQPIQRMARYPLLLQQFITTLFKHRDFVLKPLIESCCRVEKRLRILLTTTNESEVINDIVECNEFNVFYQGKFRKVSEFNVTDYTLRRSYRSKVFIFDKCIIYTEIKGKSLVLHGRYPYEHIGIVPRQKSFTLYYERRKQLECDFQADPALIEIWLELIKDISNTFIKEEQKKLRELYSRDSDHIHKKSSLALYRDSNRFSTDSGIGNIWTPPKPELEETGHRTTWYTAS